MTDFWSGFFLALNAAVVCLNIGLLIRTIRQQKAGWSAVFTALVIGGVLLCIKILQEKGMP